MHKKCKKNKRNEENNKKNGEYRSSDEQVIYERYILSHSHQGITKGSLKASSTISSFVFKQRTRGRIKKTKKSMAGINGVLVVAAILISAMASGCYGAEKGRPFSDLANTLVVTDTVQEKALKAGVDTVTVTWGLGSSATSGTDAYKTVKVKLCFAPVSQLDRPWRKTDLANIAKDKTCQFTIFTKPFTASNTTEVYTIKKEIPGATYFVRAYVYDSSDKELAYGQSTNADKTTNLFTIVGISGRTVSIDIASGVFSAFSILSLVYFFYAEKSKAKKSLEN
ncbi:uncharacterized protein [Phyllobates terribilis]|uniref:uncharacterized protein n=1 Tax=Phyllobates terribilis TaxID=111132 RepID=UPI003CCB5EEA